MIKKSILKYAVPVTCIAALIAGLAATLPNTGGTKDFVSKQNMDTTVSPGADFYQYANGGWLKNNPVPGTESRWGNFNIIENNNLTILHAILERAAANKAAVPGTNEKKLGDFFNTGMDSVKRNADGARPLMPYLGMIEGIKTNTDLIKTVARLNMKGIGSICALLPNQDDKKSSRYVFYFFQSGTSLPDRDYYLSAAPDMKDNRDAYVAHIIKMETMAGMPETQATANAAKVLEMETKLADASRTNVALRDPVKNYNMMSVKDLQTRYANIEWATIFAEYGVKMPDSIVIGQPEFVDVLNNLLKQYSIDDWKTYLRWHTIDASAPYLSDEFEIQNFNFFSKKLNGTKAMKPRWKRVYYVVNGSMGEALGQKFVEKVFSVQAKERAIGMVNNIRAAFKNRIMQLDWMSPETKKVAVDKLDRIVLKIGYPDKWRDYSSLRISKGSYLENVAQSSEFEFRRALNKVGKPVDRTEWGMYPQTVNAYYNPSNNEIVFPAAILQPPFFSNDADDALNYGGIGGVIGHEMTHGFDDQGALYDANGNLKMWWSPADTTAFNKRKMDIIRQFNNYIMLDTMHVNGKLTTGENIADLGGVNNAFDAFKMTAEYKSGAKMGGFTPAQRFFISWATVWRSNTTPQMIRMRLLTDPHSPAQIRGFAPITNMPAFYEAFNIKPGNKMYRDDANRVKIW